MKQKITPALKKKITNEWNDLFPSMAIYKPMWLMNILGPVAVGVLLHVKSDNDRYIPTLHIHNLSEQSSSISLDMWITDNNKYISTISPEEKYKEIAKTLELKAVVPIEGDVELNLLLDNLKEYCDRLPNGPKLDVFNYMAYIAGWTGVESTISKVLKYIEIEICHFEKDMLVRTGGVDKWFNSLKESIKDSEKLRKTVNDQIIELKLDKLPVRSLLY